MIYPINRISFLFCTCMGMMLFSSCIKKANNVESNKKMRNPKDVAPQSSAWLNHMNEVTAAKSSGEFQAKDKHGKYVILEWKKLTVQAPDFSVLMKCFCDIACAAYTPVEAKFLKTYSDPEVHDEYCKPFEALFKNSSQESEWHIFKNALKMKDWSKVEKMMPLIIKQIYIMDYSKFDSPDLHFFVSAKDGQTKALLGFVEFFVTPAYPFGDIKCPSFAIAPSEQNRGLGKLLISSIFKIAQNKCKRIFLSTRITNDIAQKAYSAWGFMQDANPIQEPYFPQNPNHWIFMEYKTDQANVLQKASDSLMDVK